MVEAKFPEDRKLLLFSGVISLLIFATAIFAFQAYSMQHRIEDLEHNKSQLASSLDDKNKSLNQLRSEKSSLEENVSTLENKVSELEAEKANLRGSLEQSQERALIYSSLDYWTGTGQTGELSITIYNFGESEARNIEFGCGLMREGENTFYTTITGEFGNIASNSESTEEFSFELSNNRIETGDTMVCYAIDSENGELLGEDNFADSLEQFENYESLETNTNSA